MTSLNLLVLPIQLAVCRLPADASIPVWATGNTFLSITRTADELSVVCEEGMVPPQKKAERGWRCFKVQGPLDFSLTGILNLMSVPLAEAKISIFVISTFDTDYLMVREASFEQAKQVLTGAGHSVSSN